MIKPMLLTKQKEPFDREGWINEVKFDGVRAIITINKKVHIQGRKNPNITDRYPEFADAGKWVTEECVLDGELVVFEEGLPNFNHIQKREQQRSKLKIDLACKRFPATLMAFDILELKGKDLRKLPLSERKKLLAEVVKPNGRIELSLGFKSGVELFSAMKDRGMEGIVSKKESSLYVDGKRSPDWIKVKNFKEDVIEVDNYEENNAGICLIRTKDNTRVQCSGQQAVGVRKEINKNGYARIEIQYMEFTKDGRYRMPTFRGLIK